MEILENDILIIPEDIVIPPDFPYQYYKMKFLHKPSIVFSQRGYMNTAESGLVTSTSNFIMSLLGLAKGKPIRTRQDNFLRHIRIINNKTNEYFHNKGATIMVDLRGDQGSFFFSFVICNHEDTFNKLIAKNICERKMKLGDFIEVTNYDPSLSILQNIYIAIGVQVGDYPLTDYDWTGILPELYGAFTSDQRDCLLKLRRLIRSKFKTQNVTLT
jgi:hypothetical protein